MPNDIISGSLALNIFGLINRDINDIDILIEDENTYPKYTMSKYGDDEFSTPNRLGYVEFKHKRGIFTSEKKYMVDFFHNDKNSSFIKVDFNGKSFKVHNPLEIMNYKLNMAIIYSTNYSKHNEDLTTIFGQIS